MFWHSLNSSNIFLEIILKETVPTKTLCKEMCEKNEDCNGFVWNNEQEECELKKGEVKISGEREGTWAGVMPCP
jgi:hypothetical protein